MSTARKVEDETFWVLSELFDRMHEIQKDAGLSVEEMADLLDEQLGGLGAGYKIHYEY